MTRGKTKETEKDMYKLQEAFMYQEFNGPWIGDNENGTYKNPILLSDYSDPDVIRVGKDFYMVASSFTYFPGLPVLHSKDLINWKIISYAVDKLPF